MKKNLYKPLQRQKLITKNALFIANGIVEDKLGLSGGEVRFIEIAKGWHNRGYTINLLSNKNGKEICNKFGLYVVLFQQSFLSSKTRLNFLFKTLSSFFIPHSLKNFEGLVYSTNEQLYDVLPALIIKLKSNILNLITTKNNDKNIRWGVVVHWLPPWLFWNRKESTLLNSLFFLISERISLYIACVFADVLFAVSESTKEQIKKDIFGRFFMYKVKVVNCGVDLEQITNFRKKYENNKYTKKRYDAVFIKRIQAVKGAFDLVDIWKYVVVKKPNAKLLIMGSGPDEEALNRRIKLNNLSNNIDFIGPVLDIEKKFKNIIESKVFILPSYEENWAIVIGEALACGVPIVTYKLSELQSVWKDSVSYIDVKDIQGFSSKVLELLEVYDNKKSIYLTAQKKGIAYIQQYSWDAISKDELLHLIKG